MSGKMQYDVAQVDAKANDLQLHINLMADRGFSVFQILPHTDPMIVITSKWVKGDVNVETENYTLTIYADKTGWLVPKSDGDLGIDMDPLWIPEIVDQIDNVLVEAHDKYN